AGGPARMADPPAVPDQPVRKHRPFGAREERADLLLDLHRVARIGPAEPPRKPAEVRVDRDAWHSERIAKHLLAGVTAASRQRDQVLHPARPRAAETVAERLAEADDGGRLRPEEAGRNDDLLDFAAVGGRVICGGPVARKENRRDLVDAL